MAHCGDCHTPQDGRGRPDPARALRGATLPFRHKKETEDWSGRSPDITSRGLAGEWGEAGMIKFLTTGVNPDREKPTPPMPVFRLHARDAHAIYLYLRSLPRPGEGGDTEKRTKNPQ